VCLCVCRCLCCRRRQGKAGKSETSEEERAKQRLVDNQARVKEIKKADAPQLSELN